LLVSGYSGNVGDALSYLSYHNNMMFTTYDRDNDPWNDNANKNNCAVRNGGAFWYNACSRCSVNAVQDRGENFRWYTPQTGNLLLQSSRMWLTC